jgi:hypothetical protein
MSGVPMTRAVIPAKAGIQADSVQRCATSHWIPASAGMTGVAAEETV